MQSVDEPKRKRETMYTIHIRSEEEEEGTTTTAATILTQFKPETATDLTARIHIYIRSHTLNNITKTKAKHNKYSAQPHNNNSTMLARVPRSSYTHF